jgi:hypothetical protein
MLYFAKKPSKAFSGFIKNTIVCFINQLVQYSGEDLGLSEITEMPEKEVEMFGGYKGVLVIMKSIRRAFKSKNVYMPTDYHWLLLDRAIKEHMTLFPGYNLEPDIVMRKSLERETGAKEFDIGESLIDIYFWDTDYDMDPRVFSAKNVVDQCGFTEEAFGVANRMAPHEEELMFVHEKDFDRKKWCRGDISKKVNLIVV